MRRERFYLTIDKVHPIDPGEALRARELGDSTNRNDTMTLRNMLQGCSFLTARRNRVALNFVPEIQGLERRDLLTASPPVAGNGSVTTLHDQAVSGSLYAYDMSGATVAVNRLSGPSHGTVTVSSSGAFTYTPSLYYFGQDSFTFNASSINGTSSIATETINITNRAPVAGGGSVSTLHDRPVSGTLYAYDMDGDPITVSQVVAPAHGSVAVSSSGAFTYTPNTGFVGQDSFTFKSNDRLSDSTTATETINVTDTAPVAMDINATIFSTLEEPATVSINLLSSSYDMDGDRVTLVSYGAPQQGTLTDAGNGVVIYTPNGTPFIGTDTFTYTVTDGILVAMAQAKVKVANVKVTFTLKDDGQIVEAPENSAFDADKTTSGINKLGPLDMGTGRPTDPVLKDGVYTNALMVIGKVEPGGTATTDNGITFSWDRVVSARGWNIDKEVDAAGNPIWLATENYQIGLRTAATDHTTSDFDDKTPSSTTGNIYSYDNPSANMNRYVATLTGGFMMEERMYTYFVYATQNGVRRLAGKVTIAQTIQAKRVQKAGTVAEKWQGIKNEVTIGRNSLTITEAEVRSLVGQDGVPIDIRVANPPAQ